MQNTADMKHNCNDFTLYSWHAAENLACLFNAKTFFCAGTCCGWQPHGIFRVGLDLLSNKIYSVYINCSTTRKTMKDYLDVKVLYFSIFAP